MSALASSTVTAWVMYRDSSPGYESDLRGQSPPARMQPLRPHRGPMMLVLLLMMQPQPHHNPHPAALNAETNPNTRVTVRLIFIT